MSGRIPPLSGSPWVSGPEERLIRIVLHGVRGPIVVDGKTYEVEMIGFGQILRDEDIASVLSYVRWRFGASGAPVTRERVASIREATADRTTYWTVAELLELPVSDSKAPPTH